MRFSIIRCRRCEGLIVIVLHHFNPSIDCWIPNYRLLIGRIWDGKCSEGCFGALAPSGHWMREPDGNGGKLPFNENQAEVEEIRHRRSFVKFAFLRRTFINFRFFSFKSNNTRFFFGNVLALELRGTLTFRIQTYRQPHEVKRGVPNGLMCI